MATRLKAHLKTLIDHHGVHGLARKLGVQRRTVQRWNAETVDPSPLARARLKELHQAHEAEHGPSSQPQGPQRMQAPTVPASSDGPAAGGVVPSRRMGA